MFLPSAGVFACASLFAVHISLIFMKFQTFLINYIRQLNNIIIIGNCLTFKMFCTRISSSILRLIYGVNRTVLELRYRLTFNTNSRQFPTHKQHTPLPPPGRPSLKLFNIFSYVLDALYVVAVALLNTNFKRI